MIMKKYTRKNMLVLLIIPMVVIFLFDCIMYKNEYITLDNFLISSLFGSNSKLEKKIYVLLIDNLYYIILFNFLYGSYIYDEFRNNEVYQFTRIRNRGKWFKNKFFKLLGLAVLYSTMLLMCIFVIGMYTTDDLPEIQTYLLLFRMLIMISSIIFLSTLVINILSIKLNNIEAFAIVYISILALVFIATIQNQKLPDMSKIDLENLWNPMAGLILNSKDNPLFQYFSITYYAVLSIIGFFVGNKTIGKMDISLVDNEVK